MGKVITENRKARHRYHILEKLEAGIMLTGGEIKSIRAGEVNLNEAYVTAKGNALYLQGAYIKPYNFSREEEGAATRARKLLLHKSEIDKFRGRAEQKGLTIVPLNIHITPRGLAKVDIALAKGKAAPDKRQSIKERDVKREMERELKRRS